MVSSKTCSHRVSRKSSQHLLLPAAVMPRVATAIAMAVIVVDAIVGVAVNAASGVSGVSGPSGQQAQFLMLPRTLKAHAKQNPVKKAAVAIATVALSALKLRAAMQMPLALNLTMLPPQTIAIQRRMVVMNAGVAVAIDAVVVADNALSVVKVAQKQAQR